MGVIKNRTEQQHLRKAGNVAAGLMQHLQTLLCPGVSTVVLESEANRYLQQNRCSAPFKQFDGFGHALCISLNDEIINGPPSRERVIQTGDLVKIASAACYQGLHAKIARTFYVGTPPETVKALIETTEKVLYACVQQPQLFRQVGHVPAYLAQLADTVGLMLVSDIQGCGTGKQLHEAPMIPNCVDDMAKTSDASFVSGQAFILMPLFSVGSGKWHLHPDGWTYLASDQALSAHFADTFLYTDVGAECLTR